MKWGRSFLPERQLPLFQVKSKVMPVLGADGAPEYTICIWLLVSLDPSVDSPWFRVGQLRKADSRWKFPWPVSTPSGLQEDRGLGLEGVRFAAPSSRWRCGTGKLWACRPAFSVFKLNWPTPVLLSGFWINFGWNIQTGQGNGLETVCMSHVN